MSYHLIDILQRLGEPRILVLGDLILDRYVWGDAERVSQEAPVILLRQDREELRLGGAANVANMVRGLAARATLAGIVGNDADAADLRRELQGAGVDCGPLVNDPGRPTTVKVRFIGRAQQRHPHQMLRVDREVRDAISREVADELLDRVLPLIPEHHAILISDYGKGVCTPRVLQEVIHAARNAGVPVVVDPRPGQDYQSYHGATAVTPNRLETKLATGREIRTPDDAFAAGRDLCDRVGLKYAFVTLDSDGIALVPADGMPQLLPTRKRQVYDITGAGDMVLATIGVTVAAGVSPDDMARLANVAGGLEVEQIGVVPITRDQMLQDLVQSTAGGPDKVLARDDLARHVALRRKLGQKIVLTNGCFDLLHRGHVAILEQAAREGDCLIVAVNSDASVRRLDKGPDRPLFPEADRAAMLAALGVVDYVTVFDESTPHELLKLLQPDVLVKGGTYAHDEIVGWELVEAYGGRVQPLGVLPGVSTTEIVRRLRAVEPMTIPLNPPMPTRKAG